MERPNIRGSRENPTAISAKKPVILFIDDVHWADSASLALIHYIARTVDSEKVLLLATFRSEQLTPDSEGRPHPLVETLRLMRREDLVKEIRVASLSQASVSELAKRMLGGHLQEQFAEKLADESQGNPLFIVESLRMLNERGGLVRHGDHWSLSVDELGIPLKIKDIILQRLSLLLRNQRRVLDAASVIGEKFGVEVLASVLGLSRLEIIETLDGIVKDTSLVYCEGELYGFDHARSRDAVYEEVSPALKREYHSKVAETLESKSKNGKLAVSEVAYHYAQARNVEKAIKYALVAGHDALARWSNTEAAQHFDYVLKTVGENSEHAEEKLSALEGLGDAYFASCMFKEAARIFENLANTSESNAVRLRALRKAIKSYMLFGDATQRMGLIKKAEQYAAADRLENARFLLDTAGTHGTNLRATMEDYQNALQVFEEEYSLLDAAHVLTFLGISRARLGMPKEGLAESLRSISLFEELGDFRSLMDTCFFAGLTLNTCFLPQEAFEMLTKVIEIDEKMKTGNYMQLINASVFSSVSLSIMGNFEKALTYSLKALELSRNTDSMLARGMVYANLTTLFTRLGDLKHGEEYFNELMKLPPGVQEGSFVRSTVWKAVFLAGKNQWDESNRYFNEFFEWLKDYPTPGALAGASAWFAWALERQGRLDEARVQLEAVQKIRREGEAKFEHADLRAHLMVRKQVFVGEEFEMRFDLVNVGRKPASQVKVENALSNDFKVISLPSWCTIQGGTVEMKNEEIGAFQVESVKLSLKGLKAGAFTLNPQAAYMDNLGETKTCRLNTVSIIVSQALPKVRPGRVSSGLAELDDLLHGGMLEKYSVILTASSSDERELLIQRFIETAAQAGQTTLFLTTEAGNSRALAETFSADFSLFLCGSQAELLEQILPNVYKLKGVDNLTEIDIALAKYFRKLDPSKGGPRIACVQVVSDVLLQHHAVIARKWLSSLLGNLKSKGFTTLAVINPGMHPMEEVQAILGLFDGEIKIFEKEGATGLKRVLKILKLYNQEYREDELTLTKENLKAK